MDLLPTKPVCPLCNKEVDPLKPSFRATGDFLPDGDDLSRFANASIHWDCYAKWPERLRFARHYVDAWERANHKNPFWWFVHRDDDIYIAINPQKPVEEASVRLCAVGSDIRVPLPRWPEWLANFDNITPNLVSLERDLLKKALADLRKRFPTDHALVDAIDPEEKRPRRRKATAPK